MKNNYINLTALDLEGLPQQLVNNLRLNNSVSTEFKIIEILNNHGGIMSMDHILIQIYKQTGKIIKRSDMSAKLYRMKEKELIYSIPGRKGIYSIKPVVRIEEEQKQVSDEN